MWVVWFTHFVIFLLQSACLGEASKYKRYLTSSISCKPETRGSRILWNVFIYDVTSYACLLFPNKCLRMWVTEDLLVDANFEFLTAIWTTPYLLTCYSLSTYSYRRFGKPNASVFRIKQPKASTLTECVSPKFRNYPPVDTMSRNNYIFIYYPSPTYNYYYYYVLATTIKL